MFVAFAAPLRHLMLQWYKYVNLQRNSYTTNGSDQIHLKRPFELYMHISFLSVSLVRMLSFSPTSQSFTICEIACWPETKHPISEILCEKEICIVGWNANAMMEEMKAKKKMKKKCCAHNDKTRQNDNTRTEVIERTIW